MALRLIQHEHQQGQNAAPITGVGGVWVCGASRQEGQDTPYLRLAGRPANPQHIYLVVVTRGTAGSTLSGGNVCRCGGGAVPNQHNVSLTNEFLEVKEDRNP